MCTCSSISFVYIQAISIFNYFYCIPSMITIDTSIMYIVYNYVVINNDLFADDIFIVFILSSQRTWSLKQYIRIMSESMFCYCFMFDSDKMCSIILPLYLERNFFYKHDFQILFTVTVKIRRKILIIELYGKISSIFIISWLHVLLCQRIFDTNALFL